MHKLKMRGKVASVVACAAATAGQPGEGARLCHANGLSALPRKEESCPGHIVCKSGVYGPLPGHTAVSSQACWPESAYIGLTNKTITLLSH